MSREAWKRVRIPTHTSTHRREGTHTIHPGTTALTSPVTRTTSGVASRAVFWSTLDTLVARMVATGTSTTYSSTVPKYTPHSSRDAREWWALVTSAHMVTT